MNNQKKHWIFISIAFISGFIVFLFASIFVNDSIASGQYLLGQNNKWKISYRLFLAEKRVFTDTLIINDQEIILKCHDKWPTILVKDGFSKTFADFLVSDNTKPPLSAPDFNSHYLGKRYRTMIRLGCEEGINFAGKYTLATWGCGSNCIESAIIDRRTGRIFSGPTSAGFMKYQPDSKLIICCPTDSSGYYDYFTFYAYPTYYLWENERLIELIR